MQSSREADVHKSSQRPQPSWIARAGRTAFQLVLAGISARAQAVSGSWTTRNR